MITQQLCLSCVHLPVIHLSKDVFWDGLFQEPVWQRRQLRSVACLAGAPVSHTETVRHLSDHAWVSELGVTWRGRS